MSLNKYKEKEVVEHYYKGWKNKAIRYYYYVQNGLALLNEFRYLLMGIFACYYTLKLDNPLLIPLMFIVAIPVLGVIGYIAVMHIHKVIEYLNVQFTTTWSRYNYDLNEERNQLLKQLVKEKTNDNPTNPQ